MRFLPASAALRDAHRPARRAYAHAQFVQPLHLPRIELQLPQLETVGIGEHQLGGFIGAQVVHREGGCAGGDYRLREFAAVCISRGAEAAR